MNKESSDFPGEEAINSFEKMNPLLDRYYEMHGWDKKTSWPKRETLDDLDLAYVAEDLSAAKRLP
jgi:aldehyde:ferredoxin oxidoreductase